VADLDAVGVDGPPGRGEQLDMVLGAERDRNVPGRLDQRRVLLVRGERPLRAQRIPQSFMRPVLPSVFTDRWIVSTFSDLLLLIDYMSTTENAGCCRYFWRVAGRTVGDLVGHAGMAAGRRARAGRKQQPGLTERLVPR
jgi:hypothetical protein